MKNLKFVGHNIKGSPSRYVLIVNLEAIFSTKLIGMCMIS
jgi:hypothetical protein